MTLPDAPPAGDTSHVGRTRRWVRAVAMAVYAALLVLWCVGVGMPNDSVQVFVWLWFATIAWHVEAPPRHHLQFLRDWSLPVLALVIYFLSRGLSDEMGLPVHIEMPIVVDRWLAGGTTPTEILQAAWCGDPCLKSSEPRWYDVLLTTVYATHFVAGLTVAAVLWMRSRREWAKWMRRYLGINFAALVVYVLYPMAPPWMASRDGHMGEVARITSRGWRDIGLDRVDVILQGVGNPVAAMPSLHAGISFLIALYAIQRLLSPWRWLLLAYPLLMSTALVYFAEHYVIDLVAGAALAWAVLVVADRWEARRARRGRPVVEPADDQVLAPENRTAAPRQPAVLDPTRTGPVTPDQGEPTVVKSDRVQ